MIRRVVTDSGETVGIVKTVKYKDIIITKGYNAYTILTKEEKREMLRRINRQIELAQTEYDEKQKKERHKESLRNFLDKMSDNIYLNFEQMKKAIELNSELIYMYDIISGLSDLKTTKKGIRGIDGQGNTVYIYEKDKPYFYKTAFLGMY